MNVLGRPNGTTNSIDTSSDPRSQMLSHIQGDRKFFWKDDFAGSLRCINLDKIGEWSEEVSAELEFAEEVLSGG